MELIERIIQLKSERNWSDYRLAKEAGISQSTISNLINRGNCPSIFTLEKICDAFGITLIQFFDVEDETCDLTEEQKRLVKSWNLLTPTQKDRVEVFIWGMLQK